LLSLPVRQEGIILVTEHHARIGRMVDGGEEISVVPNSGWEMHCCSWLCNKCPAKQPTNDTLGAQTIAHERRRIYCSDLLNKNFSSSCYVYSIERQGWL